MKNIPPNFGMNKPYVSTRKNTVHHCPCVLHDRTGVDYLIIFGLVVLPYVNPHLPKLILFV
jgi:hypothetical protein